MDSLKMTSIRPTRSDTQAINRNVVLVLKARAFHIMCIMFIFLIYSVNDSALLCRCTIAPRCSRILLYKLYIEKNDCSSALVVD